MNVRPLHMNPQFKVHQLKEEGQRAYVIAQLLTPTHFAVSQGTILGGRRLKSELHEPSPGMFTFRLESVTDLSGFAPGAVIGLA